MFQTAGLCISFPEYRATVKESVLSYVDILTEIHGKYICVYKKSVMDSELKD